MKRLKYSAGSNVYLKLDDVIRAKYEHKYPNGSGIKYCNQNEEKYGGIPVLITKKRYGSYEIYDKALGEILYVDSDSAFCEKAKHEIGKIVLLKESKEIKEEYIENKKSDYYKILDKFGGIPARVIETYSLESGNTYYLEDIHNHEIKYKVTDEEILDIDFKKQHFFNLGENVFIKVDDNLRKIFSIYENGLNYCSKNEKENCGIPGKLESIDTLNNCCDIYMEGLRTSFTHVPRDYIVEQTNYRVGDIVLLNDSSDFKSKFEYTFYNGLEVYNKLIEKYGGVPFEIKNIYINNKLVRFELYCPYINETKCIDDENEFTKLDNEKIKALILDNFNEKLIEKQHKLNFKVGDEVYFIFTDKLNYLFSDGCYTEFIDNGFSGHYGKIEDCNYRYGTYTIKIFDLFSNTNYRTVSGIPEDMFVSLDEAKKYRSVFDVLDSIKAHNASMYKFYSQPPEYEVFSTYEEVKIPMPFGAYWVGDARAYKLIKKRK